MHAKEIELDENGKHRATRVISFDTNCGVLEEKLIFEHDDFPDLPFGSNENNFPNGFSDDVDFEDAELINGEYVVERTGTSHQTGNPTEPYFETTNKTVFNHLKQKIRIEENGNYENFIQTFIYDSEGNLIEERISNTTNGLFNYDEKVIYVYGKKYNEKLKKMVNHLQYSKYDDYLEIFYSYSQFGDLMVRFAKEKKRNQIEITENQFIYIYDDKGNWIMKRHIVNGELISTFKREYGDFSEYFKEDNQDDDNLPF